MRFLNCGSYRACLKACLGVIRNLALKPLNHQVLREKGVMTEVLRLFSAYIQRGLVRSLPMLTICTIFLIKNLMLLH